MIAILFNEIQRSKNYVFEEDEPPTAPRAKDVGYALGAYKVFIESFVIETSKRVHSIGNSKG